MDLEYRVEFVFNLASTLLLAGSAALVLSVMFQHTQSLGGWTLDEAIALYGIYLLTDEYASDPRS